MQSPNFDEIWNCWSSHIHSEVTVQQEYTGVGNYVVDIWHVLTKEVSRYPVYFPRIPPMAKKLYAYEQGTEAVSYYMLQNCRIATALDISNSHKRFPLSLLLISREDDLKAKKVLYIVEL